MTPRQKLKIRLKIFSSIICVGLVVLVLLYKCTQLTISEKWVDWFAIAFGCWFWFDKKMLYFRKLRIISLLLCLMFLFVIVILTHRGGFASIPLASMIGRIILNKKLDTMRKIDLEAKDEREEDFLATKLKMMVYSIITAVIVGVISFIIDFFIK